MLEERESDRRTRWPGARFADAPLLVAIILFSAFAHAEGAAEIFKSRCLPCHGVKGNGNTVIARNLKLPPLDSDEVKKQSDDQIFAIISKGKDRMPAFGRKLTKEEIGHLVGYIRALKQ